MEVVSYHAIERGEEILMSCQFISEHDSEQS